MNCTVLVLFVLVLTMAGHPAIGQNPSDLRVIVHPSNSVNSLTTTELSRIYLKHQPQWSNGTQAQPIDLTPDSPVRSVFSDELLGRDVSSVRAHWQRLIFQGKGVPPPSRATEGEIVRFVSANRNAIGYVSRGAVSSSDVKVITITD